MKRIAALLLACVLFCTGFAAAEEEKEPAAVASFDFDLRFHLEADTFPFRERKKMQGYEELLDALEIRGNFSYCAETDCLDIHCQLIPVNDPEAAVSFRLFGWVRNWLNFSSPLLGDTAICFRPKEIMKFTSRAWDFFRIRLFPIALLFPNLTTEAFECLADDWERKISKLENKDVIPGERINRISTYWQADLDNNEVLRDWIQAATKTLADGDPVEYELRSLAQILLNVTDGETLTIQRDGESIRYVNHRGETLYEEHNTEQTFEAALTLPDTGTNYKPGFTFREEKAETDHSLRLNASWDRISEDEELPETFLRVNAEMEHLPYEFPADSEFSGSISVEGTVLPVFSFLVRGGTGADGKVSVSLTNPDKAEAGSALSCTGTVVPVPYEGELSYMIGDIITDFNLFALSDQSLTELVTSVMPALTEKIPDLLYALPTRGVQSLLDTLEDYGLLQTLLQ